MNILIVDDSRSMRAYLKKAIRQTGLEAPVFTEASDGYEALSALKTFTPDIIFCDWNMPGMSGLEFLQSIADRIEPIPFGFVTAEGTPSQRKSAAEAGAKFLITKPFTSEVIGKALRALTSFA